MTTHHHHGLAPGEKPHESPLVVTLPLILLAIPSVIIGYLTIGPMLHGDFFKGVIFVGDNHTGDGRAGAKTSTARSRWRSTA